MSFKAEQSLLRREWSLKQVIVKKDIPKTLKIKLYYVT